MRSAATSGWTADVRLAQASISHAAVKGGRPTSARSQAHLKEQPRTGCDPISALVGLKEGESKGQDGRHCVASSPHDF